jgi:hypothetical protein
VSSLFSFLPDEEPAAEPVADEAMTSAPTVTAAAEPLAASTAVFTGAPDMTAILAQLTGALQPFLPPSQSGLPEANVALASVTERPLAIGNYRGLEKVGAFSVAALKGGRLEAIVTFQLWANSPGDVDVAVDELQGRLLAGKDGLRLAGFLSFEATGQGLAEHLPGLDIWRKTADYKVLYEYHYRDDDGASSLIARIPITMATDEGVEFTVVTDEMIRWDNETAATLAVHGRLSLGRLAALVFVAGAEPTGAVTLRRTFEGAGGAPTSFDDWEQFLTAVNDLVAPNRHAEVTFGSLADFLAIFEPSGDPIQLGDWDEDLAPDEYQPYLLTFTSPILLPGSADRLELTHEGGAFDQIAIAYLQLLPG